MAPETKPSIAPPIKSEPKPAAKTPEPAKEIVRMGPLVLEHTIHDDGRVQTKVLQEPQMSDAEISATRNIMRRRGKG